MDHDLFISYAAVDSGIADAICAALETAGTRCWIAPRDVPAGGLYAATIAEAIHAARALVVVYSAAADDSAQVARELDIAVANGLPVLPVRIQQLQPRGAFEYYLAGCQWFDMFDAPPSAAHLEALRGAVRRLLGSGTGGESSGVGHRLTVAGVDGRREERRVVTTLICDLVGFTSLSERADPEDVSALLEAYHGAGRRVIEAHGGTVEKFIGDAVVGVFGVPTLHEDDAERAVRAGLRLVETSRSLTGPGDQEICVRVGVNTGEALVRLDVSPDSGEGFLTGDAVNTAARLQAAAPPQHVLVGAVTHELTQRTIVYEETGPITAKGKSEPVEAWLAVQPVSRTGIDMAGQELTPFVGRDADLAYLEVLLRTAATSRSPQVVLLVGEAGIGKSRLVRELFSYVEGLDELITWRRGHCPAYGEGITFQALAEVVKGHAGVLDSDDAGTVESKLEAALPAGESREWVRQRLRALVGLKAPPAGLDENYAAWLRFLEDVAAPGPTVLVFEDLHWADDALLAFVEYLAAHAADVPLLVLCTARPDLLESHPTFAAGGRINRHVLEPLSVDETAALVASVLASRYRQDWPDIAARCEGNPFLAEETARLVADTWAQGKSTGVRPAASVQAVIGARLDALPADQKALLADASVVGGVFWDGALCAISGRGSADVERALGALIGRQFVRRVRQSSLAGEREFAFGHALARDVVYGTMTRKARGEKHLAVAAWMERRFVDGGQERAEVVAAHYLTALDYARASGQDVTRETRERAVRSLADAAEQVRGLDVTAYRRYYGKAIELIDEDDPSRPRLVARWAEALAGENRHREAVDALREVIPRLVDAGDRRVAAVAMTDLAVSLGVLNEPVGDLWERALGLLESEEPSVELAEVLATYCFGVYLERGDLGASIEAANRAIAVFDQLGVHGAAKALSFRGFARLEAGDMCGLDDYERALAEARTEGLGVDLALLLFNRMGPAFVVSGPAAALEAQREGRDFCERRGIHDLSLAFQPYAVEWLAALGDWDEALRLADEVTPQLEAVGNVFDLIPLRAQHVLLLARRGRSAEAGELLAWLEDNGRKSDAMWLTTYALLAAGEARAHWGEVAEGRALLAEWTEMVPIHGEPAYAALLPGAVRSALACGAGELAAVIAAQPTAGLPLHDHVIAAVGACLAEASGEYEAAAAGFAAAAAQWHEFGVPYEEAQALFGHGRCLLALGRAPEAATVLQRSREILDGLGAAPALQDVATLLNGLSAHFQ